MDAKKNETFKTFESRKEAILEFKKKKKFKEMEKKFPAGLNVIAYADSDIISDIRSCNNILTLSNFDPFADYQLDIDSDMFDEDEDENNTNLFVISSNEDRTLLISDSNYYNGIVSCVITGHDIKFMKINEYDEDENEILDDSFQPVSFIKMIEPLSQKLINIKYEFDDWSGRVNSAKEGFIIPTNEYLEELRLMYARVIKSTEKSLKSAKKAFESLPDRDSFSLNKKR